jgi:hypothetical protein
MSSLAGEDPVQLLQGNIAPSLIAQMAHIIDYKLRIDFPSVV